MSDCGQAELLQPHPGQENAATGRETTAPGPSCPSCLLAERRPRTGLYHSGCRDCQTRMLAHSLVYHTARAAHSLTPEYRAAVALVQAAGEPLKAALARVRAWHERITGSAT